MTQCLPKKGRPLPPVSAHALLKNNPMLGEFNLFCLMQGLTLQENAHAHHNKSGNLTVRLVWRDRSAGTTTTLQQVVTIPLH